MTLKLNILRSVSTPVPVTRTQAVVMVYSHLGDKTFGRQTFGRQIFPKCSFGRQEIGRLGDNDESFGRQDVWATKVNRYI